MAEDDPPVPVLIGGVDEALGLCCSGSQRLESAEVREWHKSLTWRGHSLRRKRASLTAEVRFSSQRLGPRAVLPMVRPLQQRAISCESSFSTLVIHWRGGRN